MSLASETSYQECSQCEAHFDEAPLGEDGLRVAKMLRQACISRERL